MANFNKVILAGNLTRDPEMRYTPKGTALVNFGMAINRRWKSETGETKEEATFVDIEAWDRQAEVISQYFKKGNPILVEGRLKLDQWEDKNTHQKQSKLRVRLESFSFLGTGTGRADGAPAQPAPARPAAAPAAEPAGEPEPPQHEQDDVPF